VKAKNFIVPYPIKAFLTFLGFACHFLSIVIFIAIILPFILIVGFFRPDFLKYLQASFHAYILFLTQRLLPFLQICCITKISGFNTIDPKRAAIYIANHRGRLDALIALSILKNTGALIKSKYAVLPLYKAFVKHLDFIAVESASPRVLMTAFEKCSRQLRAGKNLLVFPEGTRASSGRLLPFKELAFRLSKDLAVPVVPLIIHSDYSFMAKRPGSIFPKKKLSYTIGFLAPVYPEKNEAPADFAFRVRALMAQHLKILDKGTIWEM
jgi:1-acyl-sn-glycerol-3-phosphate acyltransferase